MPKLIANTTVMDGGFARVLLAGVELPDWAVGKVGAHLLDGEPTPPVEVDDAVEKTVDEPAADDDDEIDFTKPPAKRTRARKK